MVQRQAISQRQIVEVWNVAAAVFSSLFVSHVAYEILEVVYKFLKAANSMKRHVAVWRHVFLV